MADQKVIAVLGATGAQGGGLVRAIMADKGGPFTARAVTRDVNSDKAKALKALGAEVVQGDVDDGDSLKRAFTGAHGAFCVTFFWAHFSPEKEMAEAKLMAQAAKQAGVQHVIWSTLEDTRRWVPLTDDRMPTLKDNYKVPHFDGKGASDHFFTDVGVPTTFLLASFYWENLIGSGPKRGEGGKLVLTMPMGDRKLAGIAAEDIGRCALGVFRKGKDLIGKTVGIAGEQLTGAQMAAALGRALKQDVVYHAIEPAVLRGFGFPGADDIGNMFQFYRDFADDVGAVRDVAASRALNPQLQTFDQWLAQNASLIKLD